MTLWYDRNVPAHIIMLPATEGAAGIKQCCNVSVCLSICLSNICPFVPCPGGENGAF